MLLLLLLRRRLRLRLRSLPRWVQERDTLDLASLSTSLDALVGQAVDLVSDSTLSSFMEASLELNLSISSTWQVF